MMIEEEVIKHVDLIIEEYKNKAMRHKDCNTLFNIYREQAEALKICKEAYELQEFSRRERQSNSLGLLD